jgi:hypothetical protein
VAPTSSTLSQVVDITQTMKYRPSAVTAQGVRRSGHKARQYQVSATSTTIPTQAARDAVNAIPNSRYKAAVQAIQPRTRPRT